MSVGFGVIVIKFGFRANVDDIKGPIEALLGGTEPGVDLFGGSKGFAFTCLTSSDCRVKSVLCSAVFFICISCETSYVPCFC